MSETLIIGILSIIGTFTGSILGVISSVKLTTFRLEQLEKKITRYEYIENTVECIRTEIKHIYHEIDEMKQREVNK